MENVKYYIGKEELEVIVKHILQEMEDNKINTVNTLVGSDNNDVPTVKAVKDALANIDSVDHVVVQSVDGKSINEMVTKPQTNTIYMFKESEEDDDWDVYIYAPVVVEGESKLTWVTLGKCKYTPDISVEAPDLTGYWSKEELVPMPESVIQEVFDAAKASLAE